MTRLDQLTRAFPDIPPSVVLKTDVFREGVQHTPDLNKIARWACPQTHNVYEYDHEELPEAHALGTGFFLIPAAFNFPDGTAVLLKLDSNSPYAIRYGEDGKYVLYRDGEPASEVYFVPRPEWLTQRTANGTLMCTVAAGHPDRCMFSACLLSYCEYFKTDDACRYCCLQFSHEKSVDLGLEKKVALNLDDLVETYAAAAREGEIAHVILTGGSFLDRRKEAALYLRALNAMKQAPSHRQSTGFIVSSQALEEEGQRGLREAGLDVMKFNFEVWDERLFERFCPGKAKWPGRKEWMRSLQKAAEIFPGHVTSNFVAGIEMIQGLGFRTYDEGIRSHLEGYEWCLQNGIVPTFTLWTVVPGSKLAEEWPSLPPTEYWLTLGIERHKLMKKYGARLPEKFFCYKCRINALDHDFQKLEAVVT